MPDVWFREERMWKASATPEIRKAHREELVEWRDRVLEMLSPQDRALVERLRSASNTESMEDRAAALDVWMAVYQDPPIPLPESVHWDPVPVIDVETDPRLSSDDRERLRALVDRASRRFNDRPD